MADSFPELLETLFVVPPQVTDRALVRAVTQLSDTLKADLVSTGAPPEVVMLAAAAVNQFTKHFDATRRSFDDGGYGDPGTERAAQSSLNNTLASLREAMARLRVIRVNPEHLQQALADRDARWTRCAASLLARSLEVAEPLAGHELQFWVQSTLWPLLQDEGLAE